MIGRQFLGTEVSQPYFLGMGMRRPLVKLSGTTLYCIHKDNIFEICMGIRVSIPYLKCSDSIPSPAGEQPNFSARMYLINAEHDILVLYTNRFFCLSLIYCNVIFLEHTFQKHCYYGRQT